MFSELPWLPNFHRKSLVTLFFAYLVLVGAVTVAILSFYALLLPGAVSEGFALLKQAISASFNLSGYKEAAPSPYKDDPTTLVMVILFAHAFSILVLNMIFQAVITAKLIKPAIDLRLSHGAVFDPGYGLKKTPHILFRLINASPFDLHLVSLKAFLVVHDEDMSDPSRSMMYYFSVPELDPQEIPVLRTLTPWIIAIPVHGKISNSIVQDYEWRLTRRAGSQPGKRQLEVLVSGNETEASTSFIRAYKIDLESGGPNGLICGDFKSLPCLLRKQDLHAINTRAPSPGEACADCTEPDCRFRMPQPATPVAAMGPTPG